MGSRADEGAPHLTTVEGKAFLALLTQQFLSISSLVSEVLLLLTSLFLVDLCLLLKNAFTTVLVAYQEGKKLYSCAQSIIFTENLNFLM